MKNKITRILVIAIVASASFSAKAGFGNFAKVALGGAIGGLTAESLNKDMGAGLDFFNRAYIHYANAVLPQSNAAAISASLLQLKADMKQTSSAQQDARGQIKVIMDEKLAKHEGLSEEAEKEIDLGQEEIGKGIAKWTAISASLGVAASQKEGQDAALAAAIPVAMELIKELPDIKNLSETASQLKKIKKSDNKNVQKINKSQASEGGAADNGSKASTPGK